MALGLPAVVTDAGLETLIATVTARILKRPPQAIDAGAPLALLGLDSLGALEVGAALEDALGVEIPPEMMTESVDVRSLAAAINSRRGVSSPLEDRAHSLEQMRADALLPDDVRPATSLGNARHPGGLLHARRVLLTGSTGFLGSRLAADLLAQSSADLLCLVRPGSATPRTRLRAALGQWGVDFDAAASRVDVIEGDLARPHFGLNKSAFAALAGRTDSILHAGASVNWVGSYSALRKANVSGTRELIRLACLAAAPFHFVSTISACYSTAGPREADEAFEGLEYLSGVHLGYAQTKIVAEELVREASRRGLTATIYRPSLISGDSSRGIFNRDDLLSLMIKGSVEMGAAPDLDWMLDCQPVDVVSRQILELSSQPGGLFHLVHDRPRHWRECLLWMRLAGYQVRLMPYQAWLRLLDERTRAAVPGGPALRPLRAFFLDRLSAADGLTRPELYEESRRTKVVARHTRSLLEPWSSGPRLDATLLDRYFETFEASGHLPRRAHQPRRLSSLVFDEAFFATVLRDGGSTAAVRRAELLGSGSDHSIIGELTAWRTGRAAGLLRYRLHLDSDDVRDVVVKVKAPDDQAVAVGAALAALCDGRVGVAYERWRDRVGLAGSHLKEAAIYAMRDPRFVRHVPQMLGCAIDPSGERVLVLEPIRQPVLMDSVMRPTAWTPQHLDLAIDGLAALHAAWFGRTDGLVDRPWIGWVPSAASMAEMRDFWNALAEHAAPSFERWAGANVVSQHRRAIESIASWWLHLERAPRTLIHHDFNPRNICFRLNDDRLRLCAYDWELATLGAPQRDLAELLCFVLTPRAAGAEIDRWIEAHRSSLERETGVDIDAADWRLGFRAALRDLLVTRLAMYALIHRVKRQEFLPRVLATWRRLDDHLAGEGDLT